MMVRALHWEKIRDQFSDEERQELRAAVTGEIICPAGFTIDLSRVNDALAAKFTTAESIARVGNVNWRGSIVGRVSR